MRLAYSKFLKSAFFETAYLAPSHSTNLVHRKCGEFVASVLEYPDEGNDCVRSGFFISLRTLELQPLKKVGNQAKSQVFPKTCPKVTYGTKMKISQSWFEIGLYGLACV